MSECIICGDLDYVRTPYTICGKCSRTGNIELISQRMCEHYVTRKKLAKDILMVAKALREYIDAIPKDVQLPVMPGIDRDFVDETITKMERLLK